MRPAPPTRKALTCRSRSSTLCGDTRPRRYPAPGRATSAGVAELVDAADSKSAARKGVSVRVRAPARVTDHRFVRSSPALWTTCRFGAPRLGYSIAARRVPDRDQSEREEHAEAKRRRPRSESLPPEASRLQKGRGGEAVGAPCESMGVSNEYTACWKCPISLHHGPTSTSTGHRQTDGLASCR